MSNKIKKVSIISLVTMLFTFSSQTTVVFSENPVSETETTSVMLESEVDYTELYKLLNQAEEVHKTAILGKMETEKLAYDSVTSEYELIDITSFKGKTVAVNFKLEYSGESWFLIALNETLSTWASSNELSILSETSQELVEDQPKVEPEKDNEVPTDKSGEEAVEKTKPVIEEEVDLKEKNSEDTKSGKVVVENNEDTESEVIDKDTKSESQMRIAIVEDQLEVKTREELQKEYLNEIRTSSSAAFSEYTATIVKPNRTIDTLPWGEEGFETVGRTKDYMFKRINIIAKSKNNNYVLTELNGKTLGWIDTRAISTEISGTKATFVRTNYSIDTLPWGISGSQNVSNSRNYLYDEVSVVATDSTNSYSLITKNDREIGWVDVRALSTHYKGYSSTIIAGNRTIDSKPWGTPGFKYLGSTSQYLYEQVEILAETSDKNYLLISLNGKQLGWVDVRAFSTHSKGYSSTIVSGNRSIDSKPWGTPGFKYLGSTSRYLYEQVEIIAETPNQSYVLVSKDGKQLGWIDVRALSTEKDGEFASIVRTGYSIDTRPWGTKGSRGVSNSQSYLYDEIEVVATDATNSYSLITSNNREVGWVDVRALSTHYADYNASIIASNRTIDSKPWGSPGYKHLDHTRNHLYERVTITAKSADNSYVLVAKNGKQLGWIDVRALSTEVQGESARIVQGGYTIDTKPWGTRGAQRVSYTSHYLNREVEVVATDSTNSYNLVLINGRELGWIDKRAVRTVPLIYIDPGHGGRWSGAHYNGVSESVINTQTAHKINSLLRARGYNTKMSRTTNRHFETSLTPDLSHRAQEAIRLNADIFVSVHFNAHPTASFSGIETYIYNQRGNSNSPYANDYNRIRQSRILANKVQSQLIKHTGANNRGVKGGNFHVIRETHMPAVLLELGFMDNASDFRKITTSRYQQILANGVVEGIDDYFGR